MLEEVWKSKCLETIHRAFRLSTSDCCSRESDLLSPWWSISQYRHTRPNQIAWQSTGDSSRRTNLRFTLVWSWWQMWLGYQPKRCWLFLRSGHLRVVQSFEQPHKNRKSSSAHYERIQLDSRAKRSHSLLCSKLLLQMWQWSCYHGSWRVHEI